MGAVDKDHNGSIDLDEFKGAFQVHFEPKAAAEDESDGADREAGSLSKPALRKKRSMEMQQHHASMVIDEVLTQLRKKLPELGLAFNAFAADKSGGKLTPAQLVSCLDSIGVDLPKDALEAFVDVLDANRDGFISFAELSTSIGVSDSSRLPGPSASGGAAAGEAAASGAGASGGPQRRGAVVLRPGTSRRIRGV